MKLIPKNTAWRWFLALVVLFTFLPSLAARLILEHQLQQLGAEEVNIRVFHLNLWNGRLTLRGLRADNPDETRLLLGELIADLDYGALWSKHLRLSELKLSGLRLHLAFSDQGLRAGPLQIPLEAEPEPSGTTPSLWPWGLNRMELADLEIHAERDKTAQRLYLNHLQVPSLEQWQPEEQAAIQLAGRLNGSPFALDGGSRPFAQSPQARFHIQTQGLDIAPLARLANILAKGLVTTDLNVTLSLKPGGALSLATDGSIGIDQPRLQEADNHLQAGSVRWQGGQKLDWGAETAVSLNGELKLRDLRIKSTAGELELQGSLRTDASLAHKGSDHFEISHQSDLDLEDLKGRFSDIKTESKRIQWQGKSQQAFTEGTLSLTADGQIKLGPLSYEDAERDFALAGLNWQGHLAGQQGKQAQPQADLNGRLEIMDLRLIDNPLALDIALGSSLWKGDIATSNQGGIESRNNLEMEALSFRHPQIEFQDARVTARGELQRGPEGQTRFAGQISTRWPQLRWRQFEARLGEQHWQGQLNLEGTELESLTGQLRLQDLALKAPGKNHLALEHLSLDSIDIHTLDEVGTGPLNLKKLNIGAAEPLLELQELEMASLEHRHTLGTVLGKIRTQGLKAELTLNQSGQPQNWLDWMTAISDASKGPKPAADSSDNTGRKVQSSANQPSAATEASPAVKVKLAGLKLEAPARLSLSDPWRGPGKPMVFDLEKLTLGELDTSSAQPTKFMLASQINRFGRLQANAEYAPFAPAPQGQWQLQLKSLTLPELSPYFEAGTGYQILSGQLSLESQGEVDKGALESNSQLQLRRFEISAKDEERVKAVDNRIGMPLPLALSILSDKKDNIRLDIPVQGALDDPQFGIQSVINILMGKVVKGAAVTYLNLALQPYGALLSLGGMAMDAAKAAALQLQPIEFAPGSTLLQSKGEDYLEKLSGLLADKPELELKLCGLGVPADRVWLETLVTQIAQRQRLEKTRIITAPQLQRWLENLATERSVQVKQQLMKGQGPTAEQLFACLPRVSSDNEDKPRVALGL